MRVIRVIRAIRLSAPNLARLCRNPKVQVWGWCLPPHIVERSDIFDMFYMGLVSGAPADGEAGNAEGSSQCGVHATRTVSEGNKNQQKPNKRVHAMTNIRKRDEAKKHCDNTHNQAQNSEMSYKKGNNTACRF
jgi:hypothetical protein